MIFLNFVSALLSKESQMVELFLLMDHPNVVHTTKNGIDHKVTVIYEISKKGFG